MTESRSGLPLRSFADATAWETWLGGQAKSAAGLWLKLAKKGNDSSTLTKSKAIDGALIHGWIDGQLDKYDERWFLIRFTPRKPRSKWSRKNRDRANELCAAGRMEPGGQAEIDAARADGRWDAAYASQSKAVVPGDLAVALATQPAAKAFFDQLSAANRYAILYRVGEAKKPETRAARIEKFVAMCARGETIH